MSYLLGCDTGTSGAKSVVIDDQGRVLGSHYVEYPLAIPKPGRAEQDPEDLWRGSAETMRAAIEKAAVSPADIVAVGLSAQSPGCILIDSDRRVLRPVHIWMDRRAIAQCDWIRENIGEDWVRQVTGLSVIDPYFALTKILWERDNEPELYRRAIKSLNQKDYILMRMTGELATDPCNAALMGIAYDYRRHDWDADLLQALGLERSKLPDVRGYEEVIGGVTAQAAAATGLLEGTPVVNGTVDGASAWLSMGCINPGDSVLTLGSSACWAVVHELGAGDAQAGEVELSIPPGLLAIENVAAPHTFLTFSATNAAGASFRWFRDQFGRQEMAEGAERGVDPYDLLTAQAEQAPAGSEGLIVLPYFMGERMPIWDTHARAVIFGLSLTHTRGHVIRAMMEGVGYSVYHSISIAKAHGLEVRPPLALVEGGAVSRLWRQIISDICGLDTAFMAGAQGAPFGDAVIAGVAMGVFGDYNVIKGWLRYSDYAHPDPERHTLYQKLFATYLSLYQNVRPNYEQLKAIYA